MLFCCCRLLIPASSSSTKLSNWNLIILHLKARAMELFYKDLKSSILSFVLLNTIISFFAASPTSDQVTQPAPSSSEIITPALPDLYTKFSHLFSLCFSATFPQFPAQHLPQLFGISLIITGFHVTKHISCVFNVSSFSFLLPCLRQKDVPELLDSQGEEAREKKQYENIHSYRL
ncbi:hypothetical protein CCH79_00000385, partial [Gambusia affinis]